ncbi:hypothetical protein ACL02P_20550 [Paenibacillus sp. MB22_1]|uniref:hypothetical protein n=1 Tax=Paenibacillus sp. MB22_1 TaxID=3383121 RepID=UPI0012F81BD8
MEAETASRLIERDRRVQVEPRLIKRDYAWTTGIAADPGQDRRGRPYLSCQGATDRNARTVAVGVQQTGTAGP